MNTQPRFPLKDIARIPPNFWRFVQQLPADRDERFRLEGSIRYAPRGEKQ